MTTSLPPRRSAGWKASAIVLIIIALISTGLWFWRASLNSGGGWQGGGATAGGNRLKHLPRQRQR